MKSAIGVRFQTAGKIYHFDPLDFSFKKGDAVIVETVRGLEYGTVALPPRELSEDDIKQPLKPVIRPATPDDMLKHRENALKEKRALEIGKEKVRHHGLEMKLLQVEYTFDGSKIVFFFTAEGRVDFRELVKDLASSFRTRIELRQIGVRDEAKMLSGIAGCGRELCCSTWLGDFEPVSIKMAKDQNLSLNPTKISGVCGRLMCCLNYEEEAYKELRKQLPKPGSKMLYNNLPAEVHDINILRQQVQLKIFQPDNSFVFQWFDVAELKLEKRPEKDSPPPEPVKKDKKKLHRPRPVKPKEV